MGISENRGTPKSSILIGFSIINQETIGDPPWLWNPLYILDKTAGVAEDDGTCMKGAADDGLAANVAQIDAWWQGVSGYPQWLTGWRVIGWVQSDLQEISGNYMKLLYKHDSLAS